MNILDLGNGLLAVNDAGTVSIDGDKIVLFADGSIQLATGKFTVAPDGSIENAKYEIRNDGSAEFAGGNLSIGNDGRIQSVAADFANFGEDNSFRINDDGYPHVGDPAVQEYVGIDADIALPGATLTIRRGIVVGFQVNLGQAKKEA